jgi:hypothetical protein
MGELHDRWLPLLRDPPFLQVITRLFPPQTPEPDQEDEAGPARIPGPYPGRGIPARQEEQHGLGKLREKGIAQPEVNGHQLLVMIEEENRPWGSRGTILRFAEEGL